MVIGTQELRSIVKEAVVEALSERIRNGQKEKEYRYGLDGLCEIIGCSKPTAIQIIKKNKVPFSRVGHKMIFEVESVLNAISNQQLISE